MNHWTIVPLIVPLLAAILLSLLPSAWYGLRQWLSSLAALIGLVVAIELLSLVAGGEVLVYRLGNWPAPFGIVLVADRLASAMVLLTALLGLLVLLFAVQGADRRGRYYHVLFQFQLFGLSGAFLTGDLFNLFVFFEVLLIASYGLLLHGGGGLRTRAGLHYVVINLVGSTLFLFAVGTLYGILGSLNMADLALRIASLSPDNLGVVKAAALLLFVVFALKAALAPLHLWLPEAYARTDPSVAALFAIMTKVGVYAILRVYTLIFGEQAGPLADLVEPWLLPLGLATIAFGAVGVLAGKSIGQIAAYLVVVSAGTLLTAIGIGGEQGLSAALYYLVHTTLATAALFLLSGYLLRARGEVGDRLETGPALERPNLVAGLFMLIAIAMAGLPPLSGFFGKVFILQAGVGHALMPWIVATILVASLLSIMGLARGGSIVFYRADEAQARQLSPGFALLWPPAMLMLCGIGVVVFAGPVYEFTQAIAGQLIAPQDYLQAVMGRATP